MAAAERSIRIPHLPPGATPPRTSNPLGTRNRIRTPRATTSTPKGPPGPNPAKESHSTHTTSRCRHHTPTWRIHGRWGTPPPPPVPGGTARGPPGAADASGLARLER